MLCAGDGPGWELPECKKPLIGSSEYMGTGRSSKHSQESRGPPLEA